MRKLVGPKGQHARDKTHRIIFECQDARRCHQHHCPPLRPLLIRDVPMTLANGLRQHTTATVVIRRRRNTILPEIRGAVVETLAHLGEFQPRGDDHNPQ